MSTTETHPYQITLEEAGPARKRLCITVPADVVDGKLQESLGTLRNQTVLPGFRKGKVPASLLERRFGQSVREETRNSLISEAWKAAMEEHALKTLGEPEPVGDSTDVNVEEGKPLSFTLEVEVMPEFELPPFDNIELTRPVIDVTEEHIDEEIDRQKTRNGNLEAVEGPVTEGDFLIGPASVVLDDADDVFYKTEETRIAVPAKDGGGQVLGVFLEDLGKTVAQASQGDELTFSTIGSDEHELEEVRGAKVVITFNIVKAVRVVPLDSEALMQMFGLESEEMLKEQVKLALERRRDQDQATVLRQQAISSIADLVEMELPEKTSAQQADRDLQRLRTDLQSSGRYTEDEVETKVAEARSGSDEESRKRLKAFFILSKLAEHFHVTVSEGEVNTKIAEIAMQNGVRPDEMRNNLAKQGQLPQIQAVVREDKAADQLVAACTVKEIPVDQWQASQDGESSKKKTTKKKTAKKAAKKKTTKKKTSKKKTTKKS
ncbi:MAG: trigger factor [Phycisphaerales bacterium]|jgi:trigger factor|nr:trigger factor [Phycisphaerales bacterium]